MGETCPLVFCSFYYVTFHGLAIDLVDVPGTKPQTQAKNHIAIGVMVKA